MKALGRVVAVLLFVTMLFSMAGCGNKTNEEANVEGKEAAQTEEKAGESDSENETTKIQEGPSWTWDTSPVEVDWFIDQNWFNVVFDPNNTLVHKIITEKTGVKINFIVPPGDAEQKLNTMIASDDYPDIITISAWLPQISRMEEAGKLYPLMELINNNAPTFKDILPDSMINWYTRKDGNWYGIPNFFDASEYEYEGQGLSSHAGFVARTDIMEELGITAEMFNSSEGFLDALRKVRDANLVENGQPIIPLLLPSEGGVGGDKFLYNSLLPGYFAIPIEDEDGNLTDTMKHPKYKEALALLNTAYREELISIENFVMQKQQIDEKMVSGNGFAYLGALGDVKSNVMDLYNNDNTKILEPYGPIRASDNAEPALSASGGNGWTVTMIPKATDKADRIIRLFEFLYSEEGNILGHWGVEGVTYQVREDGKFEYTPEFKALKESNPELATQEYGLETNYWVHNWQEIVSKMPKATEGAALLDSNLWEYYIDWSYDGRAFSNIEPDAESEAAIAKAKIDNYLLTQIPRVILAETVQDFDLEFETMLQKVDEYGQKSVTEAMNKKFQDNKAKLKIEFVWPAYQ